MRHTCSLHGRDWSDGTNALCPSCFNEAKAMLGYDGLMQSLKRMASELSDLRASHPIPPDFSVSEQPPTLATLTEHEPFDLTQIPFEAERRLGAIFREGEVKYGKNGWRSGTGDKAYQLERANHALKHLKIYVHRLEFAEHLGEAGEDDLGKVAWFCVTQMELERLEHKCAALHPNPKSSTMRGE